MNMVIKLLFQINPTSKKAINITTNMIFGSASEVARYDKANFSHVCAVCRGLRGSTKGNVYRYLDKEDRIIEPENAAYVKAKKVKNMDTGEIFENATIAEFYYQGYKSGNLSKACKGKNKTFAGFRCEYIILRYVNTEPSLRSNSLKGVTTSLYDPYGIMKSVLYR